jgi:L-alanine-DL-glutamate epimerase-like enolase superfamily enzyme
MKIESIILRQVELPLIKPYYLSFYTFESFIPIYVEVRDADGRVGLGEAQISPNAYVETRDSGLQFCKEMAEKVLGMDTAEAKSTIHAVWEESALAATAFMSALEMLEDSPILRTDKDIEIPLLTPLNSKDPAGIKEEVEQRIGEGFRTIKVKVGSTVEDDLARVVAAQRANAGRASLRIDANFAYSREEGCQFASSLDPDSIEHFEQPCDPEAWDDNKAVADVSTVPIMLDESIKTEEHIETAGSLGNIAACKLKLKRLGTVENLVKNLKRISALGMRPVLGDGTASEIGCWMEACAWRGTVDNAGEFSGFLKPKFRTLKNPLPFKDGSIHLPAGYRPELDEDVVAKHTLAEERIGPATVSLKGAAE